MLPLVSVVADGATDTVVATVATKRAAHSAKRAPAKRPAPVRAVGRSASSALEGHRSDAVGLMLLAAGVVLGLATWVHIAGRAGHAIDDAVDAVVGAVRYVVPLALVAAGVALFASTADDDKAERDQKRRCRPGADEVL